MTKFWEFLRTVLMFVGILFTLLFVWKSCQPIKESTVVTQQQYDEMRRDYEASIGVYVEKISMLLDSAKLSDSAIALLEAERDKWKAQTFANKSKADRYAMLYQDAKKALDTLKMLQSCDSLTEEYKVLSLAIVNLDQQYGEIIGAKNAVIAVKDSVISLQDSIIISQKERYSSADSTISRISTEYSEEVEAHKSTRKIGWFGMLVALIFGVLLGN